ncbi:MAG: hypothetical protein LJE83_15125 [Gammaproteobacteria bacterium]|jgi:hypothetical protein|nr:hypothetical protein [Gammaproteobacteria bacterium]
MLCLHKLQSSKIIVLACALVLFSGQALAKNYEPPKLDGFNLHDERDADGDNDGVKETHIKQYFDASGDSIVSMSTKGVVWAWSLDTRNSSLGNSNYVIRDSNCDGEFDEVYGLDEEFRLPECLNAASNKK